MRMEKIEQARAAALSTEPLRAEKRAKRLKEQSERLPHYAYKFDLFWASRPRLSIPRSVFNGDFSACFSNRQFPQHFARFIAAHSNHCEDHIKRGLHKVFTRLAVAWHQFMRAYACAGPTIVQMRNNMWRFVHDQPSLQAANVSVPLAVSETQLLVPAPGTATLFDDCFGNDASKQRSCACA